MSCFVALVAVVLVVSSSIASAGETQESPLPLFPTNERELRGALNDISYSVNRITNPNTKISSNVLERLLKSLDAPSLSQPSPTQEPLRFGRLVFGVINWSLNLAKDIKNRKVRIDTVADNATLSGSTEDSETTSKP